MARINYDKEVFLVSKRLIRNLINPINLKKTKTITYDNPACKNCIYKNSNNDFAIRYCTEFCSHKKNITSTIAINRNIKHATIVKLDTTKYTINVSINTLKKYMLNKLTERKEAYLTTIQMKLMLAYSQISNTDGIINYLKIGELASFINCTTKSIHNANRVLKEQGFITYHVHEGGELTIIINDYKRDFIQSTDTQKSSGYIVIAKELFAEIKKISKLHEFRLTLQLLLNYDSNTHFNHKTLLNVKKLKELLPKYKQTSFHLKKFLQNAFNLFSDSSEVSLTPYLGSELAFEMTDKVNGKLKRNALREQFSLNFKEILVNKIKSIKKSNIAFKIKSDNHIIPNIESKVISLTELSLEYTYDKVLNILHQTPIDILIYNPENDIDNKDNKDKFGPFLRYFLEQPFKLGSLANAFLNKSC